MKQSKNPYKDILTISVGFILLFFLFRKDFLLYIAAGAALAGLLSAHLAEKLVWAWYKLAEGLGFVSSRILLSTIFYLMLAPMAFLYRLKKKDPLQLKKKEAGSYYTTRNHLFTKEDLEKMW